MKTFVAINVVISSALIVAGSKFEATDGQKVTISFDIDDVERADQVKITFKQDEKENAVVIAQDPWRYDTNPPPGVSLRAEEGRVSVTIQDVKISRHSGLYKAQAFFGNKVCEANATLVVNKASFSSTIAPTHTPKPLNSSKHQGLYALIPLVIIVILGVVCFWKLRRTFIRQLMLKKPEKPLLSPDPVSPKERNGKPTDVIV